MLSLEGVEQFGYELWPAETFWELGMRMAGLTWNRRNPFSDGAAEDGGLSRLGRALVDELVGLGVILDLAHASPAAFAEIVERAAAHPSSARTPRAAPSTTIRATSPTTSCARSPTRAGSSASCSTRSRSTTRSARSRA